MNEFVQLLKERRSIYEIENKTLVSDEYLKDMLTQVILYAPTSFNSQSSKMVLLLRQEHKEFWNVVMQELKSRVAPEK